jgi:hypothetical protein
MLPVEVHVHRNLHPRIWSRGVTPPRDTGSMDTPTNADRDRRAADLSQRAALVRRVGWAPYESVWSAGEVLGVRAVLGEPGALAAAVELWAPTLWGIAAAEAESRCGYPRTHRWLRRLRASEQVAEELTGTEKAQGRALRAATAEWGSAMRSGDPDERHAAGEQFFQLMQQYDPRTTRDKLHVPDDAGPYRDGLVRILSRIPAGWGRWISCDAGWYPIVVALEEQLAEIDPAYEVHQCKEKFGTLRYYYSASEGVPEDDRKRMDELVDAAEVATETTCEKCGEPGELHRASTSWMKTLCPHCALLAGRGYRPAHERVDALTPDLPGIWKVTDADGSYAIWDLRMREVTPGDGDRGRIVAVPVWPRVGERSLVVVERDGVETEIVSELVAVIERVR